jgi:hypothetical protein
VREGWALPQLPAGSCGRTCKGVVQGSLAQGVVQVATIGFSEPMQNDYTCFYSKIILNSLILLHRSQIAVGPARTR